MKKGAISFHLAGFPELEEPLPGLAGSADYVGINYYRRNLVRFSPGAPGLVKLLQGPGPRSDTGVEVYPEGLLRLIRRAWKLYGLPIIVTENGVADAAGALRPDYLRAYVYAVARARDEGIPVPGYIHWSLMDNFEWAEGFEPRFGPYRVDYATLERHPTAASAAFAAFARLRPPGGKAIALLRVPHANTYPSTSRRYAPVALSGMAATSSGRPMATTRPPRAPAPGPRSMTQSATLITSRLCSMTTTVLPASTSRLRT